MARTLCSVFFLGLGLIISSLSPLSPSQASPSSPLMVGIINPAHPFSWKEGAHVRGIAADLWERIADQNSWQFRYVVMGENIDTALDRLNEGTLDVLVGPISVTNERLQNVLFSRPFFIDPIGMITEKKRLSFLSIIKIFLNNFWNSIVLTCLLVYLLFCHVLWFHQAHRDTNYPKPYFKGVGMALWVGLSSLVRLEALYKPQTPLQRLFMGCWLLFSLIIVSGFFGVITSSLTAAITGYETPVALTSENAAHMKIGALKGSTGEKIAKKFTTNTQTFATFEEGLHAVLDQKIDLMLCDLAVGAYIIQSPEFQPLRLTQTNLSYEEFAFALTPKRRDLLRATDLSLTRLQGTGTENRICKDYIGEPYQNLCFF